MSEKKIEDFIREALSGEAQDNALEFAAYLRASDMLIEKFDFYGEDKLHWEVKYRDKIVCYILIEDSEETVSWMIMPDNSSTKRFADFQADEHIKEIAWNNLNICHSGNCGGCKQGTGSRRRILGKEIDNVCGMAFNFTNPDSAALEWVKKMMDIRKNDIKGND